MPTYSVTIQSWMIKTYDIKAEDKETASETAHDLFNSDPETIGTDGASTIEIRLVEPEPEPETVPLDAETLFLALRNLYADCADYYPSMVNNSPAMKAAADLLNQTNAQDEAPFNPLTKTGDL
jgi:hypothetical protein